MKKRILLIVLIGMNFGLKAQITDTGSNVGIGTTSPQSLFHVSGLSVNPNTNTDVMAILTNTRYSSADVTGKNKLVFGWANHYAAGIAAYKTSSNTTGLKFITEYGYNVELEAMTISGIGNVGIGTSSPSGKLHVKGETYIDGWLRVLNNRGLYFQNYGGGLYMEDNTWIRTFGNKNFYHNTGIMRTDGTFQVGPSGNRFNIKTDGNVGIGTTNPGIWKLAVNGNIRAKEIKVETGWSDFVFENGYKLPTLKDVEKHIKEKGHLKDIPSAKEVEKNGIFLGEMDSKLLQKIEELTLYTIQQEKEIKSLKSMNSKLLELQKRLEKLENK